MTLALEKIGMRVGAAMHLADLELSLSELGHGAARPDARRQDLAAAHDGGARSADGGARPGRRPRRHRRRGAPAQRRHGLSAVRQLSVAHGLREHRLAAAHGAQAGGGGDRPPGARDRGAAAHRCPARPPAGGALRRPAAAHGDRARAVKGADLLLLDEPLANLDYKLREELRSELRELFAERDATVVYATTEPHEALLLGGKTAVLDEGRVLQLGPTLDVYHHPANQRVGEIFSDPPMNLVSVELAGGDGAASAGLWPSPLPGAYARAAAPGATASACAPTTSLSRADRGGAAPFPPPSSSRRSAARRPSCMRATTASASWRSARASTARAWAAGELFIDPERLFAFDANGALAAPHRRVPRGRRWRASSSRGSPTATRRSLTAPDGLRAASSWT